MNKRLLVTGIVSLLAVFTCGSVAMASSGLFDKFCSAKNLGSGDRARLCDLNTRVTNLEQRFTSIQLIQGPKGDQGPQGVQGSKGNDGVQGMPGKDGKDASSLSVFDANGNRLGKFVTEEDNSYVVQLDYIDRQISLDVDSGAFSGGLASIFFDQSNCAGNPYIQETEGKLLTRVHINNPNHFYIIPDDGLSPNNVFALSGESHGNGDCTVAGSNGLNVNAHKAQLIQLPFSIPVSGPLILQTR